MKRLFFILLLLFFSLLIYQSHSSKIHYNKYLETKLEYNIKYKKKNNTIPQKNHISIKTDVLNLKINLLGGLIQETKLLHYQNTLHSFKKLKLLSVNNNHDYFFRSGFIEVDKKPIYEKNIHYTAQRPKFELINGKKILFVPITAMIKNGIFCTKIFILKQGSYNIDIEYKIYNSNYKKFSFFLFNYFKQIIHPMDSVIHINKYYVKHGFDSISFSKDHQKYKKILLNDMVDNNRLSFVSYSGWFALLQKYFSIAWLFTNNTKNTIYAIHSNKNHAMIVGHHTSTFNILYHQKKIVKTILWVGPKIQDKMLYFAPYFDFTIDYGWFWFMSKPLLIFLKYLYLFLNNWGLSIIFITCIIRILSYPLVRSQYLSAIMINSLQSEINNIKQQYQHDKKQSSEKILELYKKHNISPFSGLIPTLIQMPIFLSLYYMLINSIELRQSPFIFWIYDLSEKDPYYVLPICMGITMFLMQKITPSSLRSRFINSRIVDYLPILLSLFFLWLPSGLVLYYIISNIMIILQQLYIYRTLKK